MSDKKNPFAGYQQDKVASRTAVIEAHLTELSKRRTQFKYITDLAAALAEKVGEVEGVPCNRATLLRNVAYKAKLLRYMADHCGAPDPLAKAEANAMTTELEAGNLRRENERLKAYIRTLERRMDTESRAGVVPALPSTDEGTMVRDYALTCKALATVLTELNTILAIGEDGAILDLSRSKSRQVLVDAKTAEPFARWWKANSA